MKRFVYSILLSIWILTLSSGCASKCTPEVIKVPDPYPVPVKCQIEPVRCGSLHHKTNPEKIMLMLECIMNLKMAAKACQ